MTDPARKLSLVKGGGGEGVDGSQPVGPEDDVQLTLMDHLRDLRTRIRNSVIALIVAFLGTYSFSEGILRWMLRPVTAAVEKAGGTIAMMGVTEGFFVYMRVAAYAAAFLASPYILYQLYLFIAPGLYRRERRLMVPFVGLGMVFFVGGGLFANYIILPFALDVLVSQYAGPASKIGVKAMLSLDATVDFVLMVIAAFGVIFELPLIMSLLARMGVVSAAFLRKYRRHAIVLNTFVAAVVTPTGDAVNLALMAVPLTVFYELGILGAVFMEKRRRDGDGLRMKDDPEDEQK